MNEQLQKKVDFAIRLLQGAEKMAEKVGQPVEICYSGGKDSDVILELARMSGIKYRAIYKNTTIDPPGTIAHARAMGCEVMQPKQTFREIIEKYGFPTRWRRICCSKLKEYKILDYSVVGVRRDESRSRKERYHEPEVCRVYSKNVRQRLYLPLLDWNAKDVAEFLTERGIKCHPLYYDEDGNFHAERRLGCMCCPLMSKKKREAEFRKYPHMLRFYINAGRKFLQTHPDGKMAKVVNNNPYDWLCSQIFCDGEREFRQRFGASPLFGNDAIDSKQFLEQQFNIKL